MDSNRFKGTVILTEAAMRALNEKPLSKVEGMVLWHLVATLPVAGAVVSNADLGEILAITRTRMSQTMKLLCEIGFLLRGSKIGVSYHYKLNPSFIKVLS